MVIMEYKNNIRKTVWVVDMGVGNTGLEMTKIGPKIGKNGGPKFVFWGRQVGAFSVFSPGHTGGPFIFCPFLRFFRKIDRLRG